MTYKLMTKIVMSFFFVLTIATSCSEKNNSIIQNDVENIETMKDQFLPTFGDKAFKSDANSDFEIYLLDINNTTTEDGLNIVGSKRYFSGPQDSYLIKRGNTEVLIDCGFTKNAFINGHSRRYFDKLDKLVTDHKLEYLVATHAHDDHINGLEEDEGLFQQIKLNNAGMSENTYSKINKIGTLIDFDSFLIHYYSSPLWVGNSQNEDAWFFNNKNSVYRRYVKTRNELINKKYIENYYPAAALFSEETFKHFFSDKEYKEALEYSTNTSMPTLFQQAKSDPYVKFSTIPTNKYHEEILEDTLVDCYKHGKLLKADKDSKAYVFDFELGEGVKLRFLNSWFYENTIVGAWNSNKKYAYAEGTSDNNISVCLEIVSPTTKFAGFGDLGGAGEDYLMKYYQGTSVLKNISVYKASHHGSTRNLENTRIFVDYVPKVTLLPSILVCPRVYLDSKDPLYNKLQPVASPKIDFFNNFKGSIFLAPSTIQYDDNGNFLVAPYNGDIHVSVKGKSINYAYTYGGEVDCYINKDKKSLKFKTFEDKEYLSVDKTPRFKEVYGG